MAVEWEMFVYPVFIVPHNVQQLAVCCGDI